MLPKRIVKRTMLKPAGIPRQNEMGIVFHSDISGSIAAAIVEETPVPTASAMLRDVVDIYSG